MLHAKANESARPRMTRAREREQRTAARRIPFQTLRARANVASITIQNMRSAIWAEGSPATMGAGKSAARSLALDKSPSLARSAAHQCEIDKSPSLAAG